MGYVEIHQQRLFFDNKKDISKIVVLKIQTMSICIGAYSTHRLLVLEKIKSTIFGASQNFPS